MESVSLIISDAVTMGSSGDITLSTVFQVSESHHKIKNDIFFFFSFIFCQKKKKNLISLNRHQIGLTLLKPSTNIYEN